MIPLLFLCALPVILIGGAGLFEYVCTRVFGTPPYTDNEGNQQ